MSRLSLYWHTLRHLRPVQIYGRVLFRLVRPKLDLRPPPPLAPVSGGFVSPARRRPSLTGPGDFNLLNESRTLAQHGWDDPAVAKLWRYNQHYFDDLNAEGATDRRAWHSALIARWIMENPPAWGTGWEPYPVSLRIVNWIKWALAGNELMPEAVDSLAVQARWLVKRLERHLLGNHFFANAKALYFAGCFFTGPEAATWRSLGASVMAEEIAEQILPDGGHFELSPMYHALALEDLLDIVNLGRCMADGNAHLAGLAEAQSHQAEARIGPMRRWLQALCHPDGEIAFFNDAATGVAPAPSELENYAQRLGFPALPELRDGVTHLSDSGYIRVQTGRMVLIADIARVGPDYLPGHAHADTLSFELSVDGRRVLVNSGTSEYGAGPERLRQRGTKAHNTLTVDDENSSEVWSGFRVARRACPSAPVITRDDSSVTIACSHDGYARLRGSPIHERTWTLTAESLVVQDFVTGPERRAIANTHFHPDLILRPEGGRGEAFRDGRPVLRWTIDHGQGAVEASTWHPEFGRSLSSQGLAVSCVGNRAAVRFTLAGLV